MYGFLSDLAWYVLEPGNLIAILAVLGLVLGLLWPRVAMWALSAAAALVVVFGILPAGSLMLAALENRFPPPDEAVIAEAAGIIVLGGAERHYTTENRKQPSLNDNADRLVMAAGLAHRFPDKPVVFSSGSATPDGFTQSDTAAMVFAAMGLAPGRVTFERQSQNTWENATRTRELLEPEEGEVWLLVTSAYHMPRAVGAFRHAGWTVIPYPVNYRTRTDLRRDFGLGLAARLRLADLAAHEWAGMIAYRLFGWSDAFYPAP